MPNELKILNGIDVETVLKSLPHGDHVNAMWFCNAAAAIESALLEKLRGGVELPEPAFGKLALNDSARWVESKSGEAAFDRDNLLQYGDARALAASEQAIDECAKVCDEADKSTHPADLADAIRALAALQAREGEAVAKVVLTKTLGLPTMQWLGLDKQFDLADGQLLYTTPQPSQAPQPALEPDMQAICAALGFDPTNHHNADKCPYCRPAPQPVLEVVCKYADMCNEEGECTNGCAEMKTTVQPMAYAVFTSNGNIRIWGHAPDDVKRIKAEFGSSLIPLYAAPQPAQPSEPAQPEQGEPDAQLCKFYQVETFPELVAAMEKHIEKLQSKRPKSRDTQPGRVREG